MARSNTRWLQQTLEEVEIPVTGGSNDSTYLTAYSETSSTSFVALSGANQIFGVVVQNGSGADFDITVADGSTDKFSISLEPSQDGGKNPIWSPHFLQFDTNVSFRKTTAGLLRYCVIYQ